MADVERGDAAALAGEGSMDLVTAAIGNAASHTRNIRNNSKRSDNGGAKKKSEKKDDFSPNQENQLLLGSSHHQRRTHDIMEDSVSEWEDIFDDYGATQNGSFSPSTNNNEKYAMMDNSASSVGSMGGSFGQHIRLSITQSLSQSVRRVQTIINEHTGSIGMLGSLSIAINNLTGPAMLSLPATFARSGIIPTTVTLLFVCGLSAFCSLHMASVISKVHNNHDFKQGVEFPEAFLAFWGRGWFVVANWLFFSCITCLNVSSLVDNAQVLDTFFGYCNPWGGAWGLAIDPLKWNMTTTQWAPSSCSERVLLEGGCIPFASTKDLDDDSYILTAGYVMTAVFFLPLAMMDLTENVQYQIFGFFVLLVISVQFIVTFYMNSDLETSQISWWGHSYDNLLGVILFNYALVITVPAWLYEKEPHVDIPTVMHTSTIVSTVLYIAIGILGCLAMSDVSDNFLESIMSGALGLQMQIGASIFAFFIIGLNIPLFCILTRLSLTGGGNEYRDTSEGNKFCSIRTANILAVYLPFGLSWMLYQGSLVTMLLNWGGMIFTSLVSFLLPLALALYVVKTQFGANKGSVRVYPWKMSNLLSSKDSQVWALRILLFVSTLAVAAAITGNVMAGPIKKTTNK